MSVPAVRPVVKYVRACFGFPPPASGLPRAWFMFRYRLFRFMNGARLRRAQSDVEFVEPVKLITEEEHEERARQQQERVLAPIAFKLGALAEELDQLRNAISDGSFFRKG